MSRLSLKTLQAAAGTGGETVYVEDVFSTYLYGGTGSAQTITNGIDLDGEGGLVWIKGRGATAFNHILEDTERGADRYLRTNTTNAELSGGGGVTAFNSNGFTTGTNGAVTSSGNDFVSWTFRKQPGFFDIVTYTGNATARTISHNLGSVPGMIIIKTLSVGDWQVYHRGLSHSGGNANQTLLRLNSSNDTSSYGNSTSYWNDTDPTSTHFSLGSGNDTNMNGVNYVAYLFAHDAQDFGEDSDEAIIKCGSYTNSGSAWSVDLGFEPQFLFTKLSDGPGSWQLTDTMRGLLAEDKTGTAYARLLKAEVANAENNAAGINITSTGFDGYGNGDTGTFIYMAIRRPQKPVSEFSATDLFAIDTRNSTGDGNEPGFRSGFPVDMSLYDQNLAGSPGYRILSRKTGTKYLDTSSGSNQQNLGTGDFDYMNGFSSDTSTSTNAISWMWRRAPGYFDVVAYPGAGSAQTIDHNLGVAPEMIWIKNRTYLSPEDWVVGHHHLNNGSSPWNYQVRLNTTASESSNAQGFNNTAPTATQFSVGYGRRQSHASYVYIAYLFASADGISKVGSYAGTGSDVNVDCGFTSGARFVLVKRVDAYTGSWYLWDSERGIVSGNDPYVTLETAAAETTTTDYIDPLSSGFTITSSAPGALNASGARYIFYAIA